MKRVYYPLTGNKGIYKPPQHQAVIVPSDQGEDYGISQGEQFEIMSSQDTVKFIASLPKSTWVYTYHSQWVTDLFSQHLEYIKRAECTGGYQVHTITTEHTQVFIVDLFQVTLDSLRKASKRLNILLAPYEAGIEQHLRSKVAAVNQFKEKYNHAISAAWKVHPSKTTGATALKTWRATIPPEVCVKSKGVKCQTISRAAIRPGGLHWSQGYYPHGFMYDINGSYIHIMRTIKLPAYVYSFINYPPFDKWIGLVKFNYQSNLQWGVIPIRSADGRVYRPTIIEGHTTTLTYLDYQLMQLTGYVEILQYKEGFTWRAQDEEYFFTEWINRLIEVSQQPEQKYLLKNVSRALHSKFAQNAGGSMLVLVKPKTQAELRSYIQNHQLKRMVVLPNGEEICQVNETRPKRFVPFMLPHWEALILAAGRLILYSNINQDTIYCDTDSIISTTPRHDLILSDGLGAWKKQAEGETAIIAPRSYMCGNVVKCSGVHAVDYDQLKTAIKAATLGEVRQVEKIEQGNLISLTDTQYKQHTIQIEKYPKVELIGNTLKVTRSPTIEIPAQVTKRLLSLDID